MYPLALLAAACLWLPTAALSQSEKYLVDRYTVLAGSKRNATSLINGLRQGAEITLTRGGTTRKFTPPTGKMDYSNADIALALAEASLKEKRITRPAPAQLEATLTEILKLRASGKGWGQIAQTHGYKLGDAKRPEKAAKAERTASAGQSARSEKPEKPK
jgi:hypothetical protein